MNVKLQYDLEFLAGIYYDDQLQLNQYSVSIALLTQTTDHASTNIALERVKCFMEYELANTVFFGPQDLEKAEMMQVLGVNVTTLPEQPIDQIIGIMLYCKFNAIMENRLVVSRLDISSALGGSVWYSQDEDDNLGPFSAESGWWHLSSTQHADSTESIPDKVVKVAPSVWHAYELAWPEDRVDVVSNNTVIYPNFHKHETQ